MIGQKETNYLDKYRELSKKQNEIEGMIGELRKICDSLKNWRETASKLAVIGSESRHPEWSEGRLKGVATLRMLLGEYESMMEQAMTLWSLLQPEEQTGLASPDSLKTS
jgi:hypothetical protein